MFGILGLFSQVCLVELPPPLMWGPTVPKVLPSAAFSGHVSLGCWILILPGGDTSVCFGLSPPGHSSGLWSPFETSSQLRQLIFLLIPSLRVAIPRHIFFPLLFPPTVSFSIRVYVCCAQLLSRVWLCDPMDCSPPGSFVHGTLQARILEQVATARLILLQGTFPTQGSTLSLLSLLHWQAGSLPARHLGNFP